MTSQAATAKVARTMSEHDFMLRVIMYARLRGWLVAHFRPARTAAGWVTAMTGDVGFPDLCMARDGIVIFAEIKSQGGKPTPGQKGWLSAIGGCAYLWKPSDWDEIMRILK